MTTVICLEIFWQKNNFVKSITMTALLERLNLMQNFHACSTQNSLTTKIKQLRYTNNILSY